MYELVYKLPLLDLPQDLIVQIMYRCDYVWLCRMATTCRALRDLEAREHAALWKNLLLRYYGESIFGGVLASSTNLGPLDLLKDQKYRDTSAEDSPSSPVPDRTVTQLNEIYEFFFEIYVGSHDFGSRGPMLVAPALLRNLGEGNFALETAHGWAAPSDWDNDNVDTVEVFAKHKPTNTIARLGDIRFNEDVWIDGGDPDPPGDYFATTADVFVVWSQYGSTSERVNPRGSIGVGGGVPFKAHAQVHFYVDPNLDEEEEQDETKWIKLRVKSFEEWWDSDDEDAVEGDAITPGQFEDELLRPGATHLKWHPCKDEWQIPERSFD